MDALDFFDMAAALLESESGLSLPARPMLATTFCFLREAHEDYGWWRHHWARALAGGPSHYRRGPLQETTFKTFSWLATRQVYEGRARARARANAKLGLGLDLALSLIHI